MTLNALTATALRRGILTSLSLTVFALSAPHVAANPMMVNMGTASDFAVLAGSGITVAGAVNTTVITGDIGTYPTTAITGLQNVTLNGVNHAGDAVTQIAKDDLVLAYNDAAMRPADATYAGGFDLVGLTLHPGVYSDASSLFLSGTLTLDAQGDPDAVFIFQAGIDSYHRIGQQSRARWWGSGLSCFLASGQFRHAGNGHRFHGEHSCSYVNHTEHGR